ncbi:MAG: maleylpyruvate isomerase family mycothiol-dependent enzyme [Nigerium sp.]|nr:maleylpyruvate isomerase family mycothiol-dependent enzyme [Nigerium sp.]
MLAILNQGQVGPVRKRIAIATQSLLRDTLALDDADWRAPSLLPGWSRAHVATHIARNADALRRVIAAARGGDPAPLYPSENTKYNDIERGAERSGLDLHVDLDTSAGELATFADRVQDWMMPVKFFGGEYPLSVIMLVRLQEVSMHHLDLDCGFTWDSIEPVPANWLLQWMLMLIRDDPTLPAFEVISSTGESARIGGAGVPRKVSGPDAALWAWLTGRTAGDGLTGTDGIVFPLAG